MATAVASTRTPGAGCSAVHESHHDDSDYRFRREYRSLTETLIRNPLPDDYTPLVTIFRDVQWMNRNFARLSYPNWLDAVIL